MVEQCLAEDLAFELATGRLSGGEARVAHAHLDSCEKCRKWVGALAQAETDSREAETELPATLPEGDRAATLAPGQVLGQFEVLRHIGSGGMSLVYAARDQQLGRGVALKVLRRTDDAMKQRLLREARAMARLSHVNVLPIYEAREQGGVVFLAMELVEGLTLRKWVSAEPRPWRSVLEVFRAAARGLAAAHEAGIVHRDFKPDNVLIGDDGRVRVMDFGLARWADVSASQSDGSLTQSGTFVGTPVYMSPEHASGEVNARSDQFSFCVSLYEALYGVRPFSGANVRELSEAMLKGTLVAPPSGRPVPSWLRRVVLRGLSPRPASRFASMAELLEALAAGERAHRRLRVASQVAAVGLTMAAAVSAWTAQPLPAPVLAAEVKPVAVPAEEPKPEPAAAEPAPVVVVEPPPPAPKPKPKPVERRPSISLDSESPYGK